MFYSELMEKLDSCKNLKRDSTLAIRKHHSRDTYLLLHMGRLWPTTKRQAEYIVNLGLCFDVLGVADVVKIESILNKYGCHGFYVFTRTKRWIRLDSETQINFIHFLKCEIRKGVFNV